MVPVSHRDRAFRPKTDRRRRNRRRLSNWLTSAQGLRVGIVVVLFGEVEWRPVFACNSRTTAAGSVHVLDDQPRRLPGCLLSKPFAEEVNGGASCILAGQAHAPAKLDGMSAVGRGNRRIVGNPARRSRDLIDVDSHAKGRGMRQMSASPEGCTPSLSRPKRPPFMVLNDARASVDAYPVATMTLTFSRHSR